MSLMAYSTLMETFGKRLRRLRQERGLTAVDFAKRARISRPHLYRLEGNHQEPTLSMLRKLAHALGVKPARLLE
jgi:transcriptional regulator with XRE-family HTH domain